MAWLAWAGGVKGWDSEQFWKSTFLEVSNAYIGHCRYNGEGLFRRDKNGWTLDEIEQHKVAVEKLKAKFPDTHKSHYKKQRDKRRDAEETGDVGVLKSARRRLKEARRAERGQ